MKKKNVAILLSFLSLGTAIVISATNGVSDIFKVGSISGEYSLNFSSTSNRATNTNGTINAKTLSGATIEFTYENVSPTSSAWGVLTTGGSLSNLYKSSGTTHNALNGLKSIQVSYTGGTGLQIGYGYYSESQKNETIKSGVTFNFNNEEPSYFKLLNPTSTNPTINSVTIKYSCNETSISLASKTLDTYTINVKEEGVQAIYDAYAAAISMPNSKLNKFDHIEINVPQSSLYLTETLKFSGNRMNNKQIIFNGNGTTIYGGNEIEKGGWTLYKDGVYVKNIGTGKSFYNLIVNDEQATLCRTEPLQGSYDKDNRVFKFSRSSLKTATGFALTKTLTGTGLICLEERWAGCIGVITNIYSKNLASGYECSLNDESSEVFFDKSIVYRDTEPWFFIANNITFLDEVNEWYYDSQNGLLYYYPSNENEINNYSFIIPEVETVLDTKGLVDNVEFKNFTFNGSSNLYPFTIGFQESQATVNVPLFQGGNGMLPSVVDINSSKFNLADCQIKNSAGNGVHVTSATHGISILNCNVLSSYGCGIFISNSGSRYASNIPTDVSVNFCTIDGFGKFHVGSIGIMATYVLNLDISHNTICHGTYTGISAGWGWTGNPEDSVHDNYSITYNKIYDVVNSKLFDGGPIYVLGGFMSGVGVLSNTISHNYLEFINGLGVIYLDEASSNYHVHDNAIKVISKDSHWHGTIFNHNPMYQEKYATVSHDNRIERNYASGTAEYKTNTYEVPGYVAYSGQTLIDYQNSHNIYVEEPILVTDSLVKPEIYYGAGDIYDADDLLQSELYVNYALSSISNPVIDKENQTLSFSAGQYGFCFTSAYLSNLIDSGYKTLSFDIQATGTGIGSIIWVSGGSLSWKSYYKEASGTSTRINLPLGSPFDTEGAILIVQARDSRGINDGTPIAANFVMKNIVLSKTSLLESNTGSCDLISATHDTFSYHLTNITYNWDKVRFMDIQYMYSLGYNSVSVSISGNRHRMYVYTHDNLHYTEENRIYTQGGVYQLQFDNTTESIDILTSHESPTGIQDEEGAYGTSETFDVVYKFNKNNFDGKIDTTFEMYNYMSGLIPSSYAENVFTVSSNGTFTVTSSLFNLLRSNGYKQFSFDIEPDSEGGTTTIVEVRYTFKDLGDGKKYYENGDEGYFCYPNTNKLSNGKFHIVISSTDSFDGWDRVMYVLRDDRGYGTAENQKLINARLSNIQFTK